MSLLKVGVAGFGVVGKRRKACLDINPATQVVGVCDRAFEAGGKLDDGTPCYHDYQQLMAQQKLDILVVCLTNEIAPEVTILGLQAGMHVFCEKPPGRNVSDIIDVMDIERKHPNLKLMYGFNHRYHDSVQEALKIIKSNKYGKVINLRGLYGKSKIVTFDQPDWRTKREIAGGGFY